MSWVDDSFVLWRPLTQVGRVVLAIAGSLFAALLMVA